MTAHQLQLEPPASHPHEMGISQTHAEQHSAVPGVLAGRDACVFVDAPS
jgi:hypothetical protein